MDKRIIYSMFHGGVAVIIPAPADRRVIADTETQRRRSETDDEFLARISVRDLPPDATDIVVCDASEIPTNRTFRNAWRRGGVAPIEVDMPVAREIHMERIRSARDAELRRLDVEQLKGNDVAAEKQRLRDTPQTIDLTEARTPEELASLWPDGMPKPD